MAQQEPDTLRNFEMNDVSHISGVHLTSGTQRASSNIEGGPGDGFICNVLS